MPDKLPEKYEGFARRYPDVWEAYRALGERCHEAGPLSDRERRLVKLGLAMATGQDGAVHAQVRQALRARLSPDEIRHAALLAIPTVGFPSAMAILAWVEDLASRKPKRIVRGGRPSR